MATVRELHDKAMGLSDQALLSKRTGKLVEAISLYQKALVFESQAAKSLEATEKNEPTRSILFLSAASMANEGGEYEEAEKLIAMGLSGKPPVEIARELRKMSKSIKKHVDMTQPKGRYIKGGQGSHWTGCEETHWDCKIEKLEREVKRLESELAISRAYADKLAAGLPDGMLPKDIENLRSANRVLAQENFELKNQNARLKKWENVAGCVEVLLDPLEENMDDPESGVELTVIIERAAQEIQTRRKKPLVWLDINKKLPDQDNQVYLVLTPSGEVKKSSYSFENGFDLDCTHYCDYPVKLDQ